MNFNRSCPFQSVQNIATAAQQQQQQRQQQQQQQSDVTSEGSRSSPLNLSTNHSSVSSSPALQQQQQQQPVTAAAASDVRTGIHACAMCALQFPTQDALALHMMYHACGGGAEVSFAHAQNNQNQNEAGAPGGGAGLGLGFARPNSAPLATVAKSGSTGLSPWMCGKCLYSFDTCDSLAMHMMTKHAHAQTQDPEMGNMAMLTQAAALANQKTVMASAAEIAQSMMHSIAQRMVQNATQGNSATATENALQRIMQQQQQQQHGTMESMVHGIAQRMAQHHQQQQALFPQQQQQHGLYDSNQGLPLSNSNSPGKRHSVQSLPDELLGHEVKKRKSSQPMKKQWHCELCEQTFPTKGEFDEHCQFCKLPSDGSAPRCSVCDVTFLDMQGLGAHLRSPVHKIKLLRSLGTQSAQGSVLPCSTANQSGEDTSHDGERSLGYFSSRSDSSSLSTYSDQDSGALIGPEGQHGGNSPANHNKGHVVSQSTKHAQSPEPSGGTPPPAQQEARSAHDNEAEPPSTRAQDRKTPIQVPCHVSQSGLSPSAEEEEEDDQSQSEDLAGDAADADHVMEFLLAHSKDLVMCKHCKIVYTDKTLYHLHMGLHNLNNQWQCNLCGKKCRNLHEFTSHVIHIKI